MCDDPLELFNGFIIQFHEDAMLGSSVSVFASLYLFNYAYCVCILVNLENRQTRIKLVCTYLKHSLLVGVGRCLECFGLSLHPLKNFELVSSVTLTRLHKSAGSPQPSLTFVISTSPYGFIMLGSSD